jgi:hypothetical protein
MGILGQKLQVVLDQIKEVAPKTYIEVGCYRCDTMHEVKKLGVPHLIGFDLFEQAPDYEEAPLDGPPITYEEAQKFGYELIKGDTNETLKKVLLGNNYERPILVYVDGGHSFETTLRDIQTVKETCSPCTILVDDTSMHGVWQAIDASGLPFKRVGIEVARADV